MALSTITAKTKITASTLNTVIDAVNSIQTATPKAYITETYVSGTSGYRKWSDGFIEQWGEMDNVSSGITPANISLHTPFSNTNYYVSPPSLSDYQSGSTNEASWCGFGAGCVNTTYFVAAKLQRKRRWYACRILTFHSKRTQFSEKEIAQNERIFYWSNFFWRIPS